MKDDEKFMEIETIVIGFIGGTGSLFLNKLFEVFKRHNDKRKTALEFAFLFEGFAIEIFNDVNGGVKVGHCSGGIKLSRAV